MRTRDAIGTVVIDAADERRGRRQWTRDHVERTRAAVRTIIAAHCDGADVPAQLEFLLREIELRSPRRDRGSQLQRFMFILAALAHGAQHDLLKERDFDYLVELAFAILHACGIDVMSSKLAYLHEDVYRQVSGIQRRRGDFAQANWTELLALHSGRRSHEGRESRVSETAGLLALRRGNAARALAIFARMDPAGRATPAVIAATASARRHLYGETVDAGPAPSDDPLTWERRRSSALRHRSSKPLCAKDHAGGALGMLEAVLHAYGHEALTSLDLAPSWRSISKRRGEIVTHGASGLVALQAVQLIRRCHDTQTPILVRIQALGEGLALAERLPDVDLELCFLAAAARWLAKAHAWEFGVVVLDRYRRLARDLSEGRTDDTLKIVEDLFIKSWYTPALQRAG